MEKSIIRWYVKGGKCINRDFHIYVAIDRNPENGCEIQSFSDSSSAIILYFKLVNKVSHEGEQEKEHYNKGLL